ncbi:MAG TPA: cytochrome C oxidase subunit IV family protein [Bacteroidales bacterium]|nr:cytochrome C oxidase subunit IV family protein [Bacteroidales bacterium]
MAHSHDQHPQNHDQGQHHAVPYSEHLRTLAALLFLTAITVVVSVFGAALSTLSVFTALFIATVKVVVVAYYFMHLKYEKKIYTGLVLLVGVLFVALSILTSLEYLNR